MKNNKIKQQKEYALRVSFTLIGILLSVVCLGALLYYHIDIFMSVIILFLINGATALIYAIIKRGSI